MGNKRYLIKNSKKIQQAKATAASLEMFKLGLESREELKDLPYDLRKRVIDYK